MAKINALTALKKMMAKWCKARPIIRELCPLVKFWEKRCHDSDKVPPNRQVEESGEWGAGESKYQDVCMKLYNIQTIK